MDSRQLIRAGAGADTSDFAAFLGLVRAYSNGDDAKRSSALAAGRTFAQIYEASLGVTFEWTEPLVEFVYAATLGYVPLPPAGGHAVARKIRSGAAPPAPSTRSASPLSQERKGPGPRRREGRPRQAAHHVVRGFGEDGLTDR